MADADKTLRYEIKTTADLAAAKEAIAVYEKLDETANKTKPSAAPAAAKDVKDLTEAMREARGPSEDYNRMLEELGLKAAEIPRSGKPVITWLGQAGEMATKAGTQTGGLAKELGGLKQASEAAGRTLGGLSQGGLGGLITAARGAIGLVSSLATGALGGLLLPVLATAGVAFGIMARAVSQNRAEMKKWYDLAAGESARTKAALAEVEKAAKSALDAQLEQVKKTADSYSEQANRIDQARARTEELTAARLKLTLAEIDAREQEQLAVAKDEAARDKIAQAASSARGNANASAAKNNVDQAGLNQFVDQQAAEAALAEARAIVDQARLAAAVAKNAAESAVGLLTQFQQEGGDITSTRATQLRESAKAAKAAADAADENVNAVQEAQKSTVEAAQARLDAAAFNQEKAAIDKQRLEAEARAVRATEEVALAKQREADAIKIKALEAEARDAAERGDNTGQDKAVAEIQKIKAAQAAAAAATQAAIDKVGAAATAIPTPEPVNVDKAVGGIIQIGNRIIEFRAGTQREINRLDDAISRVNARIDNVKAASS
jgi:hypothetical protein